MDPKIEAALAKYIDAERVAKYREIELRLKALTGDVIADARLHEAVFDIADAETKSSRFLEALLRRR